MLLPCPMYRLLHHVLSPTLAAPFRLQVKLVEVNRLLIYLLQSTCADDTAREFGQNPEPSARVVIDPFDIVQIRVGVFRVGYKAVLQEPTVDHGDNACLVAIRGKSKDRFTHNENCRPLASGQLAQLVVG